MLNRAKTGHGFASRAGRQVGKRETRPALRVSSPKTAPRTHEEDTTMSKTWIPKGRA